MDIVARIKAYPGYKDLLVKIQSQVANDADFEAFVALHRDLFGETLVFHQLSNGDGRDLSANGLTTPENPSNNSDNEANTGQAHAPDDAKIYGDTVVYNTAQKILLVQRQSTDGFMPNKWWIPGGKIESNETHAEGASRELFEEVGIKASASKLKFLEAKKLANGGTSYRYALEVDSEPTVRLQSDELQNFAWVGAEDIPKYNLLGDADELAALISLIDNPPAILSPIATRPQLPRTKTTRQKANNEAIALLDDIHAKGWTRDDLTAEQLDTLAKFTGGGGGLTNKDGTRGSDYEYYTPKELASGAWDIAKALGFNGGRVLDPSAGTGIFAAVSPESALMDSIELDTTSGGIAQILNDGQRSKTKVSPFEAIAKELPNGDDDIGYDLVITNVPFGDNGARGAYKMMDSAYQKESLDYYFIMRSLEKLKSGGLAVFITTPATIHGKSKAQHELRQRTSRIAQFLGAYRLPNSVFEDTGADVSVDVIAFKKYDEQSIATIGAYFEKGDIDTLQKAGVYWGDYLSGNYFVNRKNQILGDEEEVPDWRDKTKTIIKVKSNADITEVVAKLRHFSKATNTIDWQLLGANKPKDINYKSGDTVYRDGIQYRFDGAVWHEAADNKSDSELSKERTYNNLIAKLNTPYDAIVNNIGFEQIQDLMLWTQKTSQTGILSARITDLYKQANQQTNSKAAWLALCAGAALDMLIAKHGAGYGFKEAYPEFSAKLKDIFVLARGEKLTGQAKTGFKNVEIHYNKGDYSSLWRGDIQTEVDDNDATASYSSAIARIQYANKSPYLTLEQLKQVNPDVDVFDSNDWFITADGSKAIQASDYLIGSLADRLADIDAQINQATDEAVKQKLIKQRMVAEQLCPSIDVKKLRYDLQSPIIPVNYKVEFLKTLNEFATTEVDKSGQPKPFLDIKNVKTDEDKLIRRIGHWLKDGSLTLNGVKLDTMTPKQGIEWLNSTVNSWNEQFNNWVKVNNRLVAEVDFHVNNPKNRYYTQFDDDAPIDIAGLSDNLKLHPHQNVFVRNQGRFFGGINGMGVGLGKTASALASVQHVQNIGLKKRTLFVVPKSVLSNWRKEAKFAYANTDDCLFIGLRENGENFTIKSNLFDTDLLEAINGQYRKIFMSYEAFQRIRIKEPTLDDYVDYLGTVDRTHALTDSKKKNERAKGRGAELADRLKTKGTNNAPFIEDMNIDSIVIDEAHAFKNSIKADVGRIKFLSSPDESQRGLDAQIKVWYIRGLSSSHDGVQLLTATPITNSPVEIYNMLSLAVGRERANGMMGGVYGIDDFVSMACNIRNEDMLSIDNKDINIDVFTGLRNIDLLRSAITSTTLIKDAQDVKGLSVVIPDREEVATGVKLDSYTFDNLKSLQRAYQVAKSKLKSTNSSTLLDLDRDPDYNKIKNLYGEKDELMAHPFNLIRKMEVMIADDDFSEGVTFYDYDPAQLTKVKQAIAEFNAKQFKDETDRLSFYTDKEFATEIVEKDGDMSYVKGYKIVVQAGINDGRIYVDTMDYKTQKTFEDICEKLGVKLNVTIPAKIAAMLENFKAEMANKRGLNSDGTPSNIVKQIIFCDHLFLHNKIVRLLVEQAGIKKDKIAIITGQVNSEADEIIDIQNGFNETGEDNRYQVIVANKKAEVGINLQRGTQAIHHLTTGWTPDSLEQRNGRGARQGNHTEKVRIYYYDADGTFDSLKRNMVNKKDEWITDLLKGDAQSVNVAGDLTDADKDALINAVGDESAIQNYLSQKEKIEHEARVKEATIRQTISVDTILKNKALLEKTFLDDIDEKLINLATVAAGLVKTKAITKTPWPYDKTRFDYKFEITNDKQQAVFDKMVELVAVFLRMLKTPPKNPDIGSAEEVTRKIIFGNLGTIGTTKSYGFGSRSDGQSIRYNLEGSVFPNSTVKSASNARLSADYMSNWANMESPEYIKHQENREMAAQLIEQSVENIRDIADNFDGQLPSDAGDAIKNDKGGLFNGEFYRVGDVASVNLPISYNSNAGVARYVGVINNVSMRDDSVSITMLDNKEGSFWKNTARLTTLFGDSHQELDNSAEWASVVGLKLIKRGTDEYLEAIKEMAEIEQQLDANKSRLTNENSRYSLLVPDVAEYIEKANEPTASEAKQSLFDDLKKHVFKNVMSDTIKEDIIKTYIDRVISSDDFALKFLEEKDKERRDMFIKPLIAEIVTQSRKDGPYFTTMYKDYLDKQPSGVENKTVVIGFIMDYLEKAAKFVDGTPANELKPRTPIERFADGLFAQVFTDATNPYAKSQDTREIFAEVIGGKYMDASGNIPLHNRYVTSNLSDEERLGIAEKMLDAYMAYKKGSLILESMYNDYLLNKGLAVRLFNDYLLTKYTKAIANNTKDNR